MSGVERTAAVDPYRWSSAIRTGAPALILTSAIAVNEAFIYVGRVRYALLGHLVVLVACTTLAVSLTEGFELYQAVLLLPVFRLTNVGTLEFVFGALELMEVSLPLDPELSLHWLLVMYGVFLPVVLVAIRYNGAVDLDAGWRTGALLVPGVFILSVILASVEREVLPSVDVLPPTTLASLVVLSVVLVGVGLVEELLFRGLLQESLQASLGPWPGIVAASVAFAAMHAVYQAPAVVGYAFGFGLLLGAIYYETRSFVTVALLHGLTNAFLFGVFPTTGPWFVFG